MLSNHFILFCPLLLLPSIFPSIGVFSNKSSLHIRWPKYWSFSLSISPSNEYSGLLSFRVNWFDILAVQETLKSLLQHHSSKASILQCSALFMVQLSHLCMTTGKTTALTIWTFFGKVMSLLSNMLSRFVIAFLPRSKHLLISWLQSPSAVILEPKKNKVSVSIFSLLFVMKWHDAAKKGQQIIEKQQIWLEGRKCVRGTELHQSVHLLLSFPTGLLTHPSES